eukprot:32687-Eustigmatos_ZCMA.PRE.1
MAPIHDAARGGDLIQVCTSVFMYCVSAWLSFRATSGGLRRVRGGSGGWIWMTAAASRMAAKGCGVVVHA